MGEFQNLVSSNKVASMLFSFWNITWHLTSHCEKQTEWHQMRACTRVNHRKQLGGEWWRTGLLRSTGTQHSETWFPVFTSVSISGVIYRGNGHSSDLVIDSIPFQAGHEFACSRGVWAVFPIRTSRLLYCFGVVLCPIVFPSLPFVFEGWLTLSAWRAMLFTQQNTTGSYGWHCKTVLMEVIAEGSFRKT